MKKITLLVITVFITSCSTTLDFKVPGNRFQTAESNGRTLGARAALGYGRALKYELAKLYGDNVFSSSNVSLEVNESIFDSEGVHFDASLGIIPELDFYYSDFHDAARIFGLKWQFFGEYGKDKEGHKVAFLMGLGTGEENSTAVALRDDNSNKKLYSADLDIFAGEASLIYSYRFTRNFLTYAGYTHSIYDTEAKLEGAGVPDELIKGKVITNSFLVGFELSSGERGPGLMFETGYNKGVWRSKFSRDDIPLGASFFYNY